MPLPFGFGPLALVHPSALSLTLFLTLLPLPTLLTLTLCPHPIKIPIAVGMLRVPILHHFPFLLLVSTVATLGISFLITKAGSLRYFFGLPNQADSRIPGRALKGLIPMIVLIIIIAIEFALAKLL